MALANNAEKYLSAFENNEEFPGGLSYRQALHQCRLDYSRDSLKRIDLLLDQIRPKHARSFDSFIKNHANQNFLYLLCFYVGKTIERNSDGSVSWLTYDELLADDPKIAGLWPRQFETSVVFQLQSTRGGGQFLPLSPIIRRLFEGEHGKSVWFSATGYMNPDVVYSPPSTSAPAPAAESAPSLHYKDGQAVQVGDAVLFDGGLFPARVARIVMDESGIDILLEDGEEGFRKITVQAAANDLVLARRNSVKFFKDAVHWLENNARDNIPGVAMNSTAHAQFALGNLYSIGQGVEVDPSKATEFWLRSAGREYGAAQYQLGLMYQLGKWVPADSKKSLEFFRRAGRNRNAKALTTLGVIHEQGKLVVRDETAAAKYYQQASDLGDANAMCNLAGLLLDGRGVKKNSAQGVNMLTRSAEMGVANAQFHLGLLYSEEGAVARDYAKAVRWYSRAAEQGYAMAICNLADKYEHGLGVSKDIDKAVELYRRAAEGNVIAAWYSLGNMYQDGRGVPQDTATAAQWMEKAAHYNFLDATERLAIMLGAVTKHAVKDGEALLAISSAQSAEALHEQASNIYNPKAPETMPIAFALYLEAAKQGHYEAQLQVAFRYRRGLGVQKDPARAIEWYLKSANQGYDEAQVALAEMYEAGEGAPRNDAQAQHWWKLAEKQGHYAAAGKVRK